jgi:hypothetical protein
VEVDGLPPRNAVASPGERFNGLALLKLLEQFEQWPGVGILETQPLSNLARRGRPVPKLKKTQYVIGA